MKKLMIFSIFALLIIAAYILLMPTTESNCPLLPTLQEKFKGDLSERYQSSTAFDCGYFKERRAGNDTALYGCLERSMQDCAESKAFIEVQGFERRYSYLYETGADCKVKIHAKSCAISAITCKNLVRHEALHTGSVQGSCN